MKTKTLVYKMDAAEYMRLRYDDCGGICLACGAIHDSGVEPDAEGYTCDACGARRVVGIEQALVLGRLDIVEEDLNDGPDDTDRFGY